MSSLSVLLRKTLEEKNNSKFYFSFTKVEFDLQPKKWHFVLATWNPQNGILIFVDGPLLALEPKATPIKAKVDEKTLDNHHISIGIKDIQLLF